MLLLREPSLQQINDFLASQKGKPFSYPEVGATRNGAPPGYKVDRNRVRLGTGDEAFKIAVEAMRQWKMFDLGWVRVAFPGAQIQEGTTVGVVARTLGIWSLNAARIVFTLDENEGGVRRFGFAYGTLRDHAETGEERFTIEHRRLDGSVWYELFAFSRPQHWFVQIGYPVSRVYQKRFARDSKAVMQRAVEQRLG